MTYPAQSKYALIGQETSGTAGTSGTAFAGGSWLSGTAGTTTPNDIGLIISDITENLTREIIESSGISRIQVQKITSGMTSAGVTIEGDFQHGRLFKYIVGPDVSVNTTNDYTHTFSIAQSPPAASLEVGNNLVTDTVLKHVGQLIESAELSIALNENLKLAVTFLGKSANTKEGGASAAIISTLPVFPHQTCEVKLNGTAATEIQNASITVTKTVERSGGIGSVIYQQGHAVDLKFEFTANLGFQDATYQNLFLSGTTATGINESADPSGFEFEINANNGVTLGSGRRGITFTVENCISSTFDETATVGGLTFIDISGTGTLKTLETVDNINIL